MHLSQPAWQPWQPVEVREQRLYARAEGRDRLVCGNGRGYKEQTPCLLPQSTGSLVPPAMRQQPLPQQRPVTFFGIRYVWGGLRCPRKGHHLVAGLLLCVNMFYGQPSVYAAMLLRRAWSRTRGVASRGKQAGRSIASRYGRPRYPRFAVH